MTAITNRIAYYVGDGDADTNDGDRCASAIWKSTCSTKRSVRAVLRVIGKSLAHKGSPKSTRW